MKYNKTIIILIIIIAVLSLVSSAIGLFSGGGYGRYEFVSINKEIVKIYGTGIYMNDSVSIASQGIASDFVTLFMGIPLLLLSAYLTVKGSFKGKILLTGTLGYFLYTYMSYTFLWMYNRLFMVYVLLMSLSLYAFVLAMISFDLEKISKNFNKNLPVKFLGSYQIFIAVTIGLMWIAKIAPSVINDSVPVGLEHYTTLVIQGMDLGFVVPTAILSGTLLIKKRPLGYLLSSVVIIKSITMLSAISAMIINQALNSVKMSMGEIVIFPIFNLMSIICLVILLKNTRGNKAIIKETICYR